MAYLIQAFLPLVDKGGVRFPRHYYEDVERELLSRFDGFTAYPRAPASGLWKAEDAEVQYDELVIYEVITHELNRSWWEKFRSSMEVRFKQDRILMRSQEIEII